MAFRDDKDALVERLTDLERDLHETRKGLEQKDEELRRLRERLGGLDAKASSPRRTATLVGVALGLVVMGGVGWLVASKQPPPRVAPAMQPPATTTPAEPPPPPPSPPVAPTPTVETPPPKPAPSADLSWNATVRTSTGPFATVRPGTRCKIDVGATGGAELDFHRIAVQCGETVVYDTTAPMRGTIMSQTSGSLTEVAKADHFVYRLMYRDVGTRTLEARPQIEIGTERRIGRVYHEGVLGGALDLAVDKDSQPRKGEALGAAKGE
jgi:hypothetical protein